VVISYIQACTYQLCVSVSCTVPLYWINTWLCSIFTIYCMDYMGMCKGYNFMARRCSSLFGCFG